MEFDEVKNIKLNRIFLDSDEYDSDEKEFYTIIFNE